MLRRAACPAFSDNDYAGLMWTNKDRWGLVERIEGSNPSRSATCLLTGVYPCSSQTRESAGSRGLVFIGAH